MESGEDSFLSVGLFSLSFMTLSSIFEVGIGQAGAGSYRTRRMRTVGGWGGR